MVVSLTMSHYKLFSSALVPSKDGIELPAKGSVKIHKAIMALGYM